MSAEPLLDADDIQGNILAGFNKDHQILVGLRIDDVVAAKSWLRAIHGTISSTSEVLRFNRLFRAFKARTGQEPQSLTSTGLNIAFSYDGIRKLTSQSEADALPDVAFRIGMPARSAAILGDSADALSPYHPSKWRVGGPGNVPDILLILASDRSEMVQELLDHVLAEAGAGAVTELYRESGDTRSDEPGHEHFGFKDGISQPGVRGVVSAVPSDFLTSRLFDPTDPLSQDFAQPGTPLIMPGQFVLGYDTQSPKDGAVVPATALPQPWFRNGSFLVFRRLCQKVAAFREFVAEAEATLQGSIPGITAGQIAAAFVGRWPDGEPLVRAPRAPNPLMADAIAANAFAFANAMPTVALAAGKADAKPPAPADALGLVCPHWAHVRKVNPRDEATDLGDEFDTLTRRLLRRGIPYGASLPPGEPDDGVERGLLFLAYHASITQSFEKVTQDWVNNPLNPQPGGHDPVIGQASTPGRARTISFLGANGAQVTPLTLDREWVFPTGGGYFFAPSRSAILGRLAQAETT